MGGRGSKSGAGGGGTRVTVPERKQRRGSGGGRRKSARGEQGSPYGDKLPLPPAGEKTAQERSQGQ